MTWCDFTALLVDAAQQPAFLVACALCVVIGGALAVGAARAAAPDEEPGDAGDTQADWPAHLP